MDGTTLHCMIRVQCTTSSIQVFLKQSFRTSKSKQKASSAMDALSLISTISLEEKPTVMSHTTWNKHLSGKK